MAISNQVHGDRMPGYIGKPLPSVEVRLVDDKRDIVSGNSCADEIQIKSSSVFKEYMDKPDKTREAFTNDR